MHPATIIFAVVFSLFGCLFSSRFSRFAEDNGSSPTMAHGGKKVKRLNGRIHLRDVSTLVYTRMDNTDSRRD